MKRAQRKSVYKLNVDLTQTVKQAFRSTTNEEIIQAIGGYMKLMNPPENAQEITMSPNEIRQTGLLAAQCLSQLLYGRLKGDKDFVVLEPDGGCVDLPSNLTSEPADKGAIDADVCGTTVVSSPC